MKLYAGGYLAFYLPQRKNSIEMQLSAPTPLEAILGNLQIPIEEVHLVVLNGEQADMETAVIHDTDVLQIFSGVNGG